MKQLKIFDSNELYKRLDSAGDPLIKLNECIEWSIFDQILLQAKPDRTQTEKGGRPPLSNRKMFKIMILQSINNVSDEAMEYLLNDRLSWSRFVDMVIMEKGPVANSIRQFREILTQTEAYNELFEKFNEEMVKMGVITKRGSIVDATFVDVPRQRVRKSEYEEIKGGEVPDRLLMPGNENEL
jgi:transposase